MKDKFSGEPRGFGFVDMPSQKDGVSAIAGVNGKNVKGQILKVDEARPKQDRRSPGGGSHGGRRY
jgi:cold-inducible RNA-binding protein